MGPAGVRAGEASQRAAQTVQYSGCVEYMISLVRVIVCREQPIIKVGAGFRHMTNWQLSAEPPCAPCSIELIVIMMLHDSGPQ